MIFENGYGKWKNIKKKVSAMGSEGLNFANTILTRIISEKYFDETNSASGQKNIMSFLCVCDKMRRVTRGESQGQGEDEEEAGGMLQMLQIYVGDTQNGKHLEVWRNNRHRFIF